MSTEQEQIYVIIAKYLQGNITDKESVILESWKLKDAGNRNELNDISDLWYRTGKFSFPEKIDSTRALSDVHKKSGMQSRNVLKLTLVRQIAAILLLSVLFSGLYSYFFSDQGSGIYQEEIQAAYGTRTRVELPDGSFVFLNSGSSLRFSSQLGQSKERKVELKGEGYFEVSKDNRRPFIVQLERLSVEALGTSFNVNAYDPDLHIDVVLVEGKVAVRSRPEEKSKSELILTPNQLARFDVATNNLVKESLDNPGKYTGWTEGRMIFVDDPIRDVIQRLENWYHVEIRVQDRQLLNYRLTGTFVDEPLEEILNAFSLTSPLHYEIAPGIKNNRGEYSKRTVTLKHK